MVYSPIQNFILIMKITLKKHNKRVYIKVIETPANLPYFLKNNFGINIYSICETIYKIPQISKNDFKKLLD